jgi:hypothetical protein
MLTALPVNLGLAAQRTPLGICMCKLMAHWLNGNRAALPHQAANSSHMGR